MSQAAAQSEKNDWLLGGSARFWQYNRSGESLYQIAASGDAGFFWHKNFVSGLRPTLSLTYSNRDFNTVIFTRYYHHFKTVSPYIEVNGGYGVLDFYRATNGELLSRTESGLIGARLGGAFWVTPRVSFDAFIYSTVLNSTVHNVQGSVGGSYQTRESINGLGIGFQILL